MKFIPSIYIQQGKVVSLYKGNDNDLKKHYPKAAKSYAKWFAGQGAEALFIVDLDGDQRDRLKEIKEVFPGEIWWAGKVRDVDSIRSLLKHGAGRIVLGQSSKDIYKEALEEFGAEKLIAGVKVKHSEQGADECEILSGTGFTDVLVKDLNAEGTLFMPSFDIFEKCVYFSGMNVYASGGLSEDRHIKILQSLGVKGAVIGRAFYENHISLEHLQSYFHE
ncbi:MAG: phosphoribosylformimino-5-aminoimidazole carboxamide ribotide isomerase [Oceanicoccus sp.]|jgi:phosphoribosylformimino-5-aminoimidazole carboxamide ribotide isomerase